MANAAVRTKAQAPAMEDPDHEPVPRVTTPQGTQENAVERGHEGRDIDFRKIVGWFTALVVLIVVVQFLLWGQFRLLKSRADRRDVLPSPLFSIPQPPPEPRLLPNPVESRQNPTEPPRGPGTTAVLDFRQEDEALERHGLWDTKTGRPRLPDAVVKSLTRPQTPAGGGAGVGAQGVKDPLHLEMPSDASGGLSMENRLD